jgi:methylmalonyl-CoA carboxyltransferase large subunit
MKPTTDLARLVDAVESLRGEVSRLSERVAALEANRSAAVPAAEEISEELVLVISAAIAAFLGKKPHIRQIRLLRSDAWAQEGRTTIQASHKLSAPATRRSP